MHIHHIITYVYIRWSGQILIKLIKSLKGSCYRWVYCLLLKEVVLFESHRNMMKVTHFAGLSLYQFLADWLENISKSELLFGKVLFFLESWCVSLMSHMSGFPGRKMETTTSFRLTSASAYAFLGWTDSGAVLMQIMLELLLDRLSKPHYFDLSRVKTIWMKCNIYLYYIPWIVCSTTMT